jgi:hypothetical protein
MQSQRRPVQSGNTIKRALIGLVAVICVVAGLPATAHAGGGLPPCGTVCDGKDPDTYKYVYNHQVPDGWVYCKTDAVNKQAPKTVEHATIQLRYSNHCETTWITINIDPGYTCVCDFYVVSYHGSVRRMTLKNPQVSYGNWTLMLDDHDNLNYGCVYVFANEDDYAANKVEASGCTLSY